MFDRTCSAIDLSASAGHAGKLITLHEVTKVGYLHCQSRNHMLRLKGYFRIWALNVSSVGSIHSKMCKRART
jgi:hypothetical protein